MTSDGFGMGLYSPRVAARVARIRPQSFQAWAKANLLQPLRVAKGEERGGAVYTYKDLLLIRLIVRLRAEGIRPRNIRIALDTIASVSGGDRDAWMRARLLVTSGLVVVVFPDTTEWNSMAASEGTQKMAEVFFPELIEQLKEELVPPIQFPFIEVDPQVLGGAPVVKGTRVSTRAVVSIEDSGQDPLEAYPDLSKEQVANAKAYEEFLKAA